MTATYVNLAVRAPLEEAVGVLEVAGVPGLVGPQAGEWCGVFVDGDDGMVGSQRRPLSAVAARLSDRVDSTVLLVSLFESRVLGYDLFDHGKAVDYYVSRPGEWTGEDLPSEGGDAQQLAVTCGLPDAAGQVAEVLVRDAEADEVHRHARLTELLALPPYLVGVAAADARERADDDYVVLEPRPAAGTDRSMAVRVTALALCGLALFLWVWAFLQGSWGTGVLALVVTAAAVLAGWLSVGAVRGRGDDD